MILLSSQACYKLYFTFDRFKRKKRLTLASLKLNSISMPSTPSALNAGFRLRLGLQGLQNNTETSLTSPLGDADRGRL